YFALAGCLFFGLYQFMQPSRYANPGMAAFKPPATSIAFVQLRTNDGMEPNSLQAFASAESETIGKTAPKLDTPAVPKRRQRTARHEDMRRLMMNYPAQPFFGAYRPQYNHWDCRARC